MKYFYEITIVVVLFVYLLTFIPLLLKWYNLREKNFDKKEKKKLIYHFLQIISQPFTIFTLGISFLALSKAF